MNLIFVYNANSGVINSTIDSLHKVLSPKTYQCSLCNLTHGSFNEKKEWSDFIKESTYTYLFLHKDEFEEHYKQKFSYPCMLNQSEEKLELVVDANKMNSFKTLEELINEIKNIKA